MTRLSRAGDGSGAAGEWVTIAGVPVDHVVRLIDGRNLSIRVWGTEGPATVFSHGTPDARLVGPVDPNVLSGRGLRLITVDRPGYGGSSPHATSPLTVAHDMVAALDHLGIERVVSAGWSAGGVFALALAAVAPHRISEVRLVAPVFPMERATDAAQFPADLARSSRLLHRLHLPPRLLRPILRIGLARQIRSDRENPSARLESLRAGERAVVDRHPGLDEQIVSARVDALRQSGRGWIADVVWMLRPPPFAYADVACPVTIWHGDRDEAIQPAASQRWAQQLANVNVITVPDAGHLVVHDLWASLTAAPAG